MSTNQYAGVGDTYFEGDQYVAKLASKRPDQSRVISKPAPQKSHVRVPTFGDTLAEGDRVVEQMRKSR